MASEHGTMYSVLVRGVFCAMNAERILQKHRSMHIPGPDAMRVMPSHCNPATTVAAHCEQIHATAAYIQRNG